MCSVFAQMCGFVLARKRWTRHVFIAGWAPRPAPGNTPLSACSSDSPESRTSRRATPNFSAGCAGDVLEDTPCSALRRKQHKKSGWLHTSAQYVLRPAPLRWLSCFAFTTSNVGVCIARLHYPLGLDRTLLGCHTSHTQRAPQLLVIQCVAALVICHGVLRRRTRYVQAPTNPG